MKNYIFLFLTFPFFLYSQNPNYSENIAPIIYNKCLQCHHSNGISPISLETYASTVANAGMIQHVTSTGEMPPWPPDTNYRRFAYENILTLDEINDITDWIANGVPLGDTNLLPPFPILNGNSNLGTPDLILQIPTYTSTANLNSDDYVCFSIPTNLFQNRKIRAIEVLPGNVQIVHHVLVSIDPFPNSSVVTTSNCMGAQGKMIYSYAPGSLPLVYPDTINNSFGVELPANSSISLSMHYPEGSLGEIDSTKVNFYFYPQNTSIREISNDFLINEGLFGVPFILPPYQITEVMGSFGPTTQDFSLMSVFPHMHLLGKEIEFYAVAPSNDTINLIRINNWDFEWQGAYFFKKFLKIPAGSMIYAEASYDNTVSLSNPNPITVQSGFNTQDEMLVGAFQYLPYQPGDEYISIENTSIITNNNTTSLNSSNKKNVQIFDFLGRKVLNKSNQLLLYIYDDGTTEKRILVE